jgi:uncharacterized protein YbaP (TraB family)
MKRLLLILWALLLAAPAAAVPALWVLRDSDTELALYGSVHALPKGLDWFSPAARARFDAADTLVLEAVIPDDKTSLGRFVADLGTRPGLKPLISRVGSKAAPDLIAATARVGLPLARLDQLKTWLAAVTIGEVSLASIGISAADGVEPALLQRAQGQNKPVIGLESIEQQLRYLDGLPEADQLRMLRATIADAGTARADTDRLVALWQAGDVAAIARDFAREAKASPRLQKTLITDRNRRWADWIAGAMRRPGRVFVAVGAGHFGGADGLLALLKARGLRAGPVVEGAGVALPAIAAGTVPLSPPPAEAAATPAKQPARAGGRDAKKAGAAKNGKKAAAKQPAKPGKQARRKSKR